MCTTCSTLLSASLVSGMMQDPATLTKDQCEFHMRLVMGESAKLHQLLLEIKPTRDPMLQIAEVVSFLETNDHAKLFKLRPRYECFFIAESMKLETQKCALQDRVLRADPALEYSRVGQGHLRGHPARRPGHQDEQGGHSRCPDYQGTHNVYLQVHQPHVVCL